MVVRVGPSWKLRTKELMLLNCSVGEDSWESLGLWGDQASPSLRKSILNIHWKDWCCSWSSNILATWCEELTHFKRPWCWKRLKAGGEEDDRRWDGWMASPTQWTWVWVNFGRWWWTGRPGMWQFMGSQIVRHDWWLTNNSNDTLHCDLPPHLLPEELQPCPMWSFCVYFSMCCIYHLLMSRICPLET